MQRISYYGGRRVEDFDKYEALRYAEDLASVAKSSNDPKAASYDIIASTLREKLHVPAEQFKAYFLSLLANKDFSRVIETVSKIDKSSSGSSHIAHRRVEDDCRISNRFFPPLSAATSACYLLQMW